MTTPNITLNNGVEMPQLGLGVYQMDDQQVRDSIPLALKAGYRLIDTASRYYNERLSDAIEDADIARDEAVHHRKLWFKDHGYDQTKQALQVSLDNLGLDYLDLWLIHQPFGDYYGSWRAMEDLMDEGLCGPLESRTTLMTATSISSPTIESYLRSTSARLTR